MQIIMQKKRHTATCGIQVEADKHSNQSYAEQEHTQHRISQNPPPCDSDENSRLKGGKEAPQPPKGGEKLV